MAPSFTFSSPSLDALGQGSSNEVLMKTADSAYCMLVDANIDRLCCSWRPLLSPSSAVAAPIVFARTGGASDGGRSKSDWNASWSRISENANDTNVHPSQLLCLCLRLLPCVCLRVFCCRRHSRDPIPGSLIRSNVFSLTGSVVYHCIPYLFHFQLQCQSHLKLNFQLRFQLHYQ